MTPFIGCRARQGGSIAAGEMRPCECPGASPECGALWADDDYRYYVAAQYPYLRRYGVRMLSVLEGEAVAAGVRYRRDDP